MTTTREDAITALMVTLNAAYTWKIPGARRLKLWTEVPAASRPTFFAAQNAPETYGYSGDHSMMRKRSIEVRLFIYTTCGQPGGTATIGAIEQDAIMEALDAALTPQGSDLSGGRATLGGVVYSARIEGNVEREPGDLDGDGILVVPIKIIIP
jgi:hypothetical protein